jgi:predicted transcriptional regulator
MAIKIVDLNDRLFSQFDHLQNRKLTGEELAEEINRSKASVEVAHAIIANASIIVQAHRLSESAGTIKLPSMLTD